MLPTVHETRLLSKNLSFHIISSCSTDGKSDNDDVSSHNSCGDFEIQKSKSQRKTQNAN